MFLQPMQPGVSPYFSMSAFLMYILRATDSGISESLGMTSASPASGFGTRAPSSASTFGVGSHGIPTTARTFSESHRLSSGTPLMVAALYVPYVVPMMFSSVRLSRPSHTPSRSFASNLSILASALNGMNCTTSTIPGLLNSCLESQHRGLLVRLEVHILLDTVDVLNALLNKVSGVSLPRGTLAGAGVTEERPRLALPHHEHWYPISGIGISALHETEVGADCWHAWRLPGHQRMLFHECARLQTMRTPCFVVDMLLQCMPLDLCPRRHRWMLNTFCSRARSKVRIWGCRYFRIGLDHNIRTAIDSGRLDFQLAFSLVLILGPVVVLIAIVIVHYVAICPAEHVLRCVAAPRSCPNQEPPRCRRDPVVTLLVPHLLVIHRINS